MIGSRGCFAEGHARSFSSHHHDGDDDHYRNAATDLWIRSSNGRQFQKLWSGIDWRYGFGHFVYLARHPCLLHLDRRCKGSRAFPGGQDVAGFFGVKSLFGNASPNGHLFG